MKRLAMLLPIVMLAGCSFKNHSIPGAAPEFAKADYTVLGKTNHEECGTYILGIDWGHLLSNQSGGRMAPESSAGGIAAILGSLMGGSREESRAMYHALDKMPEATHLLAHRTHTTSTGLVIAGTPFFGQRCAAVEARGVKIGDKPFEGQAGL